MARVRNRSRNRSRKVSRRVNRSRRVNHSRNRSRRVNHSRNRSRRVSHSRNRSRRVSHSRKKYKGGSESSEQPAEGLWSIKEAVEKGFGLGEDFNFGPNLAWRDPRMVDPAIFQILKLMQPCLSECKRELPPPKWYQIINDPEAHRKYEQQRKECSTNCENQGRVEYNNMKMIEAGIDPFTCTAVGVDQETGKKIEATTLGESGVSHLKNLRNYAGSIFGRLGLNQQA